MRRRLTALAFIAAAIVTITAFPLTAQQPTGTPNFNTFQTFPGGVIINLGNLDVHLQLPIYHKAGLVTPFDAKWNYDNEIWYLNGNAWNTASNISGSLGASVLPGSPAKYTIEGSVYCTATQSTDDFWWTNFTFTDPSGTTHSFPNANPIAYPSCGSYIQQTSGNSADGYTMTAAVNPNTWAISSTVRAPDGTVFQGTSGTGSGTRTDRNDNVISVAGGINGQYTDTLGGVVLEGSSSGNTITYKYDGECGTMCESVTETTANYYIASAFAAGCSGSIDTVSNNTTALPIKFALPDGSAYQLSWEQTPGKSSAYSTGRIRSITLPTGGVISFNYSSVYNNGMNCDGSTSVMTVTTPDGVWTYNHSAPGGTYQTSGTNATDPTGYQWSYTFFSMPSLGPVETIRQVYSPSNAVVKTVISCYNGQAPSQCAYSPNQISSISQITRYIELPMSNGVTAESDINENYNPANQLLTERDETNWGGNAPGGVVRKTTFEYGSYNGSSCTSLGNNIINLPCRITTYYGTSTQNALTEFVRDTNGNPTSIRYATGTTTLTKNYTYKTNGTVLTFTDTNNDSYSYTYDCSGAFPSSVSEPAGLTKSMTWNCDGGVMTSVTDEAGVTTTINYSGEAFWRPSSIVDPMGNTTSFLYSPTTYESTLNFGSSTVDNLTTYDGLGRVHVSQKKQGPGSSYFDSVETDYNSDGQISRVTQPYAAGAEATNPSAPATSYAYDGLGRTSAITDGGGGSVSFSYNGNLVTKTISPGPPWDGETAKTWEYAYNGIGQLEDVCEEMPSGAGGSGVCGFDGTNATLNGFWTEYSHDALGDLTGVTQNAQSGTTQSRTYTYDQLGRLTKEINPETGGTANPITYTYDIAQPGDLYQRTDLNGTITYTHGAFHRLLTASAGGSFCRNFLYDSGNAYSGIANPALVNGRLAKASTTNCATGSEGSASVVQTVSSTSCSGTSCTLTVAATGANHLLTLVAGFASNVSISSVSGGGSWVCPSGAVAANGTALGSAACYVLGSTSGASSIVINLTGSPGSGIWVAEFREYSVSGTPSFDTAGAVSDSTCSSCAGASLTLTGTNDLIVQMINPSYMASGVSSGWTDTDFPGNDFGVADEIGTSSGAAPTWTTTSGIATASALAFNLGSGGTVFTTEYFDYDPDGDTTDLWQSTPDSGGLYHVTDQYYPNSVVNTLVANNSSGSLFTGLPTMTYGVDGEGRPITVMAGAGQNPVTAASYNVASQLTSLTYGSGDSDAYTYDPSSGRMTQYQFSINGSNVTGALTWNKNGTLQQLLITDPFDSPNSQTCQYQYDPIARLNQVNCGTTWGQSFSYDAYGNVTKTVLTGDSGLNWQPGYDNNNHYTLSGTSYDADGDLTNDTFFTYTWNSLGDLASIDGNLQYHDAFGRLVEWKDASGTIYELMYSPAGAKIGMMTGQTLAVGRVPLPSGAIASFGPSGLNNYAHADWLGSTRFSSYTNQTEKWDLAHAPYGEVYDPIGGGAEFTFTGHFSDYGTTNTLWDSPMREYHSSQGRWISPDPAGLAAINPMNPQTWNRYAYVGGNPLGNVDPLGLCFQGQVSNPAGLEGSLNAGYTLGTDNNTECPDMLTAQPWLTMTNFGCIYFGLCNVPEEFGGTTGQGTASTTLQWIKRTLRTIGNYIPTICGGGVFNYGGLHLSGDVASVSLSQIRMADTRSGYAEGPFTDASFGEGVMGGYGQAVFSSGGNEQFLFGGAGGDVGITKASVSVFGSHVSGSSALQNSIGVNGDAGVSIFGGGVGLYVNTDSITSCIDHSGS